MQTEVDIPKTAVINLRSGSIFVSLLKLHSGGHGETKRVDQAQF